MNRNWIIALPLSLVLGAGCGASGATNNATEQVADACSPAPLVLTGTVVEGGSCSLGTDCKPSCCTCSSGGKSWLGASCVGGKCQNPVTACANTKDDSKFCR